MSAPTALRLALIDLLAPARSVDRRALAALGESDWVAIWALARAHRLEPLLHARLRGNAPPEVPAWIARQCAWVFKRRSLRSVEATRELLLIRRDLDRAGIAFIAMKGAYLAHHAYAEAGMRPLRDLDILVARDDAMAAWHALRARGLTPAVAGGDVARQLEVKHQLPPLTSPQTGMLVEIHHRAFHGSDDDPDLTGDPGFADRMIEREVAGQTLRFMGAEDLLLHLIVHSVYDHRFDNGPAVLADIAAMLATHSLDWPLFWSIAGRQDRVRGAIFALRMAQDYWGASPIGWGEHGAEAAAIPAEVMADAAALSLRDLDSSADLALAHATRGRSGAGKLVRKLFPRPALLRGAYANRGRRSELPGLYLRKWRDILVTRLPRYARALRASGHSEDAGALRRVSDWLEQSC